MKFLKIAFFLSIALWNVHSIAGESGFLFQGKEYITFRDGKKVGPAPYDILREEGKRVPASEVDSEQAGTDLLYFQRKDAMTCFFPANHAGVSCVRSDSAR